MAVPFFLYKVGAPPSSGGSFHPFILYRVGSGTAVTRKPAVGWPDGGFTYDPKEKRQRGFSRKYALELLAAERALDHAQVKVKEAKRERKAALATAIKAAEDTLDRASMVEAPTTELRRLTNALEAASSARKVSQAIALADEAVTAAKAFLEILKTARQREDDAIILLLID